MASLYELGSAPQAERGRGRRRTGTFGIIIIATLIAGLCAAGGGVAGIVALNSRHPTPAQIAAAGQREYGLLWERMSAGQIFPGTASYLNTLGFSTTATRVGIAPQASCGAAVDAGTAQVLAEDGCVTSPECRPAAHRPAARASRAPGPVASRTSAALLRAAAIRTDLFVRTERRDSLYGSFQCRDAMARIWLSTLGVLSRPTG